MAAARSAEGVRPEDSASMVGSAVGSHGSWSVVANEQWLHQPLRRCPCSSKAPPPGFRVEDKEAAPTHEADPDPDQNVPSR